MLQPNIAVSLQEESTGFVGFVAENNLYLVIKVTDGFPQEVGKKALRLFSDTLLQVKISNLASWELCLSDIIKKANLPANINLSAAYQKDKILYLKTIGEGIIFLKRGREFVKIIDGTKSASGFLEDNDFFVFTTKHTVGIFGSEDLFKKRISSKEPREAADEMTSESVKAGQTGFISLFIRFSRDYFEKEETTKEIPPLAPTKNLPSSFSLPLTNFFSKIRQYSEKSGKRKTLTFIVVILILFVLIWSVGLGYKRRAEDERNKKITIAQELIVQKLNQAEDVAFLNLPRSMALLTEAKTELEKLKKEIGEKRKEISGIELLIKEKENKIVKKEEKNYEEFFDLTIDNKNAVGDRIYLDSDVAGILDSANGNIYLLSLQKKSLEKRVSSEIKKANSIGLYQNRVVFYISGEGVYLFDDSDKVKKVIDNDKDWGDIIDIYMYNGNVYLLDRVKDQVYKYLVAEGGFSAKSSYFSQGQVSLKGANSLAIDSSIYIGFTDYVAKYTAGARDEFKTSFPEEDVFITKIFTSRDVEKVYAWSKKYGSIYILGKNGSYERQIKSSAIAKADDFVVFNNTAYLLVKEKIYKIGLE